MSLDAATTALYVRHVFAGMNSVLDRLDDVSVNATPEPWGTNTVAGLIVHCCELAPSWFETPGLGRETVRDREAEFEAQATVAELRTRIVATVARLEPLIVEFTTGPTAVGHEYRAFLPGGDTSDDALVLHVFEELFQHLGHMEVTADAVENRR